MMSQPILQSKLTIRDADSPVPPTLQPLLSQIAEQLNEIHSKLNVLNALSIQMNALPQSRAPFGERTLPLPNALAYTESESAQGQVAPLRVYCFGRFEVYDGDQPVPLQRAGKGNLILKFLAIARQPVLRDVLLETIWPESDPQVSNNRLKVAVHHLRKTFAQSLDAEDIEIVSFRDGVYQLNPDLEIWSDVHEFEMLYQAARQAERAGRMPEAAEYYSRAEALYRGDLLEQDVFEEWTLVPRETLKDTYLTLLDKLAAYFMSTSETDRAIEKWKKIIAQDAGREDAYRHLMQCYAERGQRAVALRWYDACVQALREQLNVEPEAETQALYQTLRRHTTRVA